LAGLDLNGLAGGRIAAHAGGPLAHLENTEPADADAVTLLEVLGHQPDQIAEDRLGLFFRHFMRFREIRGEMLQRHRRLCARFLRCHGWPSSFESGRQSHSSHCRIRRFGWCLTMTSWRKIWVFSMPHRKKWPMTGLDAGRRSAKCLIRPWILAFHRVRGGEPSSALGCGHRLAAAVMSYRGV